MYPIVFTDKSKKDYNQLRKESVKLVAKMMDLIFDIFKNPYEGLGKPETLKGNYQGFWSRRISDKHRLIYCIKENQLIIFACYGHYDDK